MKGCSRYNHLTLVSVFLKVLMNPDLPRLGVFTRTSVSLPSSESCPGIQLKIEVNTLKPHILQNKNFRVLVLSWHFVTPQESTE